MQDYSSFPSVTEDEFVKDPDVYLEKVNQGEGPFLIHNNDGESSCSLGGRITGSASGPSIPKEKKKELKKPAETQNRMKTRCRAMRKP